MNLIVNLTHTISTNKNVGWLTLLGCDSVRQASEFLVFYYVLFLRGPSYKWFYIAYKVKRDIM